METLPLMSEIVHLDTNVVIKIASKEQHLLPPSVIRHINNSALMISPAVILELQYLCEIKKIEGNALKTIEKLQSLIGLEICRDPFEFVIRESLHLSWTRDPFDRLIVAQALMTKTPLLTKDREIRRHYSRAVWE
jgi:PIN domain nuclease of toxin-antitoxin system